MSTGGSASVRGYLLQTIICLLDALHNDSEWESLVLEPDLESEKVDIFWFYAPRGAARATQVRSSQNQIKKSQAVLWAQQLEGSIQATSYELILIGPCSQSVANLRMVGNVQIPTPKMLDLQGLLEQAAHRLDRYSEGRQLPRVSAATRELLASALVTKLQTYSTHSKPVSRGEFNKLLDDWLVKAIAQPDDVALLRALLDELPTIRQLDFQHARTQTWHNTVKVSLRRIFGESSYYVTEYDKIAWSTRPEDTEEQRALFLRSCDSAEGWLTTAIRELTGKA